MKILYILDKPNLYGSEMHVLGLVDNFLNKKDYQVELLTFSDGPLLKKNQFANCYIYPLSWVISLRLFVNLIRVIKNLSPDVIHCHQPKAILIGSIIGRILKIPTVVTIHSRPLDHALIHRKLLKRTVTFLFHYLVHFIAELVTLRIIYVSETMYKQSKFKNKSFYIPNWLRKDVDIVKVKNEPISDERCYKFIMVGSVTKAKGFDLLLEFVLNMRAMSYKLSIDVFGGVDEKFFNSVTSFSEALTSINLHGYVDNPFQTGEYDFFILLSRSETFGLSYLEAMSQGLPIICLDLPEIRNLIPKGNVIGSTPIELSNLFVAFLKNKNYLTVSKNNIERSRSYGHTKIMDKIETIYKELM